jgi:hypothetical protein
MSIWRYYVSSCTCEGAVAIYSDGKTVRARCAECQGDMEIGRTERELHDRVVSNLPREGVPDNTDAANPYREPVDGDPDF